MEKIYQLRNEVDKYLEDINTPDKFAALRHLSGVSELCAIIAMRRDLDVVVCYAAGILHDLWLYIYDTEDNHAILGAELAKEILKDIHGFSGEEISVIINMIMKHSDKGNVDGEYEEALKDADVLHHYLTEPSKAFVKSKSQRIKKTLRELSINIKVNKK